MTLTIVRGDAVDTVDDARCGICDALGAEHQCAACHEAVCGAHATEVRGAASTPVVICAECGQDGRWIIRPLGAPARTPNAEGSR